MDFTKFIDSRDIAEHLKKLDYKFTAPEAAYLVYQSGRATLEEKFAAWEYIIENFSDCSLEKRSDMDRIDSFHEFLRKYINLQKRRCHDFNVAGKNVYTVTIRIRPNTNRNAWIRDETNILIDEDDYSHHCFSNIISCHKFLEQRLECYKEMGEEVLRIIIEKYPLDSMEEPLYTSYLHMNSELKVLSVHTSYCPDEDLQTDVAFDGMAFAFPTPFERGDILTGWDHGEIFVLDHLPTWNSKKCAEQGVLDRITEHADRDLERLIKEGDESYMNAYGYAFGKDGIYYDNFGMGNYLKCEYLREQLKGKQRVLKPLSSFLKGYIEEELLCHAYHYILLEEDLAAQRRFLSLDYLQETLDDAGITVAKDS